MKILFPVKARLGGLYEEIPERLIQIAIESVNYDEEKARHLLMLMINEEKENKEDIKDLMKGDPAEKNVGVNILPSLKIHLLKNN